MVGAACCCPSKFEPRIAGGEARAETGPGRKDPGDAVNAALTTLGHVVQERGDDQVALRLAAFDQPTGRAGAVHDVSWVLAAKEREELAIEVAGGQFEVIAGGQGGRVSKLPEPGAH